LVTDPTRKPLSSHLSPRQLLAVLVIATGAFLLAEGLGYLRFVDSVENSSYDWRVRQTARPVSPSSPIVIVDISETSVRALEPLVGRWPWPRAVHAAAIDYMAGAGAKVIAYDILFGEREGRSQTTINGQVVTGDQSDRALAEAVGRAGNVILLGEATFEGSTGAGARIDADRPLELPGPLYAPGPGFRLRPTFQLPFDDLRLVARGVGHNLLVRDSGSDFARRMLPFVEIGGVAVPSLGVAAALAFRDVSPDRVVLDGEFLRLGEVAMPLGAESAVAADGSSSPSRQALLRFAQPVTGADGVRSVFPSYSFFDVLLSGDQLAAGKTPAVPPAAFAGKLVFVGTSAAGTFDRYSTPFDGGAGGVELHATLAENVLSGTFMRRASAASDMAVTAVAAAAAALLAVLLPVVWATVGVLVFAAALVWWLTEAVGDGHWIAVVQPGLAAATALFGGVAWQYFVEGRQKREIKRLFGRYVSKDVIEQLMADPRLANLGGQRREMTVLFSDIRGFTTASEKGTPEAVVLQLNEYFGAMVEVLFRHRGTLDKFVGDMVMGLFGAPLEDPDHADHAVETALEMVEVLGQLNSRWSAEGRPTLDIGIGVNTGEMIAGNIGAEAIMSYTVIGDAVNLGARLESLNKDYGTRILISEMTRARLRQPFVTRMIGPVTVKGKTQSVIVHEVIGRPV
jgi:adenylate cyclase